MKEVKAVSAVKMVRLIFGIVLISLIVFSIGCSSNSYVVSGNAKKVKIADDVPEELKVHILKLYSSNTTEHIYGAMMLGKYGRKAVKAVPYLLDVLNSHQNDIKKPVIAALSEIGDPRATESLIVILEDRSSPLRADAAAALGKLGDYRAVEPLIARLSDKTIVDRAVVVNSALALAEIKDIRAVEPLIKSLKDYIDLIPRVLWEIDSEWQNSAAAINTVSDYLWMLRNPDMYDYDCPQIAAALGKMGRSVISPLFSMMMDENVLSRKYAAQALEAAGWKPNNQSEEIIYLIASQNWDKIENMGEVVFFHLSTSLADRDKGVRAAAAGVLSKAGWVANNQSEEIKFLLASRKWDKLMKIGSPAAASLSNILRDADLSIRENAARILVRIGEPSIEPLIALLKDRRAYTRMIAVSSLNKIDPSWRENESAKDAIGGLIAAMDNPDSNRRRSAAWALGELNDPCSVDPLIKALQDKDQSVRIYAAKALGKIADTRTVEPLIFMLNDRDSAVRGYAARALGEIKNNKALEPLIVELKDRNSWPRVSAKVALKRIDPDWTQSEAAKNAVPVIISSLKNDDTGVKRGAVSALSEIGDPRAIEPLVNALRDDNIRFHAAKALGKLTGETFGEDYDTWQKWLTARCKKRLEYCMVIVAQKK